MDTSAAPVEVPEVTPPPEMTETRAIYISPFTEPQIKRRRRRGSRKGKSTKGKGMRKSRRRRRQAKVPKERLRKVLPAPVRYICPHYMPMPF